MKKTGLLALGLALAIGVVAEAGSIPTNRVPLQTYAIKKVNCYLQPNGTQKGWIDPGDYVVVTQIRSDGWAYGSYPVGKGRTSRWFRADDLVNNTGFTNQERYSPRANTYTYTNPNHNKQFGSFNNNEPILVVSDSGQSRQFIYKLNSGGYKMAWVPYWDCWDARQAGKQQVNNNTINTNPIVKPVQREEKKQEQSSSYGVWKATARYRANTYDNPNLSGARVGWVTAGSNLEVLGENSKSYYIRYWTDNGTPRERYVERTAVKGLNEKPQPSDNDSTSYWDGKVNTQLANLSNLCYRSQSTYNPFKKSYTYKGVYHPTNCTWYAFGRMQEVCGIKLKARGNAKTWGDAEKSDNNVIVNKTISSKCVGVRLTGGGGAGHVVFIEYVDNSGYVYFTEANVNNKTDLKVRKEAKSFFDNYTWFIHPK